MTKPQLENGYTRIANEILDVLVKQHLSGQEIRAVLLVIRKTYGFHKKSDEISYNQIAKYLNVSRVRAVHVIKKLLVMKILLASNKNITSINRLEFNKHFDGWLVIKKALGSASYKKSHQLVMKKTPTKDIFTKDNIIYSEVIGYLNNKTNRNYRATNAHKKLMEARIKEGYGLDDFKKVIDNKVEDWIEDAKLHKYLRPMTLFGPKFDSYLQEDK